jgi:hypothetical protein
MKSRISLNDAFKSRANYTSRRVVSYYVDRFTTEM